MSSCQFGRTASPPPPVVGVSVVSSVDPALALDEAAAEVSPAEVPASPALSSPLLSPHATSNQDAPNKTLRSDAMRADCHSCRRGTQPASGRGVTRGPGSPDHLAPLPTLTVTREAYTCTA
jgi:hypothetical protein